MPTSTREQSLSAETGWADDKNRQRNACAAKRLWMYLYTDQRWTTERLEVTKLVKIYKMRSVSEYRRGLIAVKKVIAEAITTAVMWHIKRARNVDQESTVAS